MTKWALAAAMLAAAAAVNLAAGAPAGAAAADEAQLALRAERARAHGALLGSSGSCSGECGGYGADCWCDAYCTDLGDCCADFTSSCCYDAGTQTVAGGACPGTCSVSYESAAPAIPTGTFFGSTLKITAASDCGTSGYPAATYEGSTVYYGLSYTDNREATYLAAYDAASGAFLGGYNVDGLRYTCAMLCYGEFLYLLGQSFLLQALPLDWLQLSSGAHDGVMGYPAEEARITPSCFSIDDEFSCGWYCLQALYVELSEDDGRVTLDPFGEGNLADEATCTDCSLFQGSGTLSGGSSLTDTGAMASGQLNGGYKWSAVYDSSAQEVLVNYTDYEEPCEIRYMVLAGEVMGVAPADGRPFTANGDAVVKLTRSGAEDPTYEDACESVLPGCETWQVRVDGDVADWISVDEGEDPALTCPARVQVWSTVNGEYTGHDGVPRGSDSGAHGGEVLSTRNSVVSWDPPTATRCEQYFDVESGCFDGVGPDCGDGAHARAQRETMARVRAKVAQVRARRAAKGLELGPRADIDGHAAEDALAARLGQPQQQRKSKQPRAAATAYGGPGRAHERAARLAAARGDEFRRAPEAADEWWATARVDPVLLAAVGALAVALVMLGARRARKPAPHGFADAPMYGAVGAAAPLLPAGAA